ncbi:MAG: 8-amino-7-oxononanoate synthase [Deltaproteobacteria bacterium]
MTDPLGWIDDELQALDRQGLRRRRREMTPLADGRCRVDGRELLNFSSNDYLNLAHDPRVVAAAREALDRAGAGATASALVSGRTPWHVELENRLARFERQAAALLFPSGFAANVGTICALAGKDDTIFSDRLNHASLIDGCRLSHAQVRIYGHDDLAELEGGLRKCPASGRRLIVTDSVFSMDGDLAPLPELCDLAERFRAILMVDEAHATGVLGERGRGVAELQGVEERVTVRVGTLSKAVGALGGFVAGSQPLVDWLWNRARPQIYSTALPPAVCAAARAAIDIIEAEPERRRYLLQLAGEFRRKLIEAGFATVRNGVGPIVPILLETPDRAMHAARQLEQEGFLAAAIRPPTVPPGTSRLRFTLTSEHKPADVEALVGALQRAGGYFPPLPPFLSQLALSQSGPKR